MLILIRNDTTTRQNSKHLFPSRPSSRVKRSGKSSLACHNFFSFTKTDFKIKKKNKSHKKLLGRLLVLSLLKTRGEKENTKIMRSSSACLSRANAAPRTTATTLVFQSKKKKKEVGVRFFFFFSLLTPLRFRSVFGLRA